MRKRLMTAGFTTIPLIKYDRDNHRMIVIPHVSADAIVDPILHIQVLLATTNN